MRAMPPMPFVSKTTGASSGEAAILFAENPARSTTGGSAR